MPVGFCISSTSSKQVDSETSGASRSAMQKQLKAEILFLENKFI